MPQQRNRRERSTLSTYAPLLITLTIATAGALAWIWSERRNSDDEDESRPQYPPAAGPSNAPPPSSTVTGPPPYSGPYGAEPGFFQRTGAAGYQVLDGARGLVGAAGTALGFSSVDGDEQQQQSSRPDARRGNGSRAGKRPVGADAREDGFSDHERWTEQAVLLKDKASGAIGTGASVGDSTLPVQSEPGRVRSVAVVLAAEERHLQTETGNLDEHASILSHLPTQPPNTRVYILVCLAPPMTDLAQTSPLYVQARTLTGGVPSQVLPFSTPTGYVHMLRHLAPGLVYLQDTPALSGADGQNVAQLKGWVGQTVLVVGEDGTGGLADTETETEGETATAGNETRRVGKWYETTELVGLGKGLEVVDVARLRDDWVRRTAA